MIAAKMSSRGAARRRISWELVDDTDESDSDVYPKLEESYIHDLMLRAEINHALYEFRWNAVVDLCEEALAERPRWSEVRAARDRAASYLETGGQSPPSPVFYVVVPGAFVKYNMNWGPRAANPETKMVDYVRLRGGGGDLQRLNVPRKSFLDDVPDDALLLVMQCLSYPRCALLAATNKRLLALFKSRPLAARRAARRAWHLTVTAMRDNALYNAMASRRLTSLKYGFDESAIGELALIAKDFPEALQERHLPPYAIKRTGIMRHGAWRYSRVFGKTPDEVWDNCTSRPTGWHGILPDVPITPLELAVSDPDVHDRGEVVNTLLNLGASPTKLALDIAHRNCNYDLGCWAQELVSHSPQLVVSDGKLAHGAYEDGNYDFAFDLDFCAMCIDSECDDDGEYYRVCKHLVKDRGVVPTVGVNMAADGAFAEKYPQEVVDEWLEDASFKKYCTACEGVEARDGFSEEEWALPRMRYCLECNLYRRLVAFYQRHNPAMTPYQIDAIMREWGQNEPELLRQMAAKYGQRAVDDAPVPAREVRVGDRGGL